MSNLREIVKGHVISETKNEWVNVSSEEQAIMVSYLEKEGHFDGTRGTGSLSQKNERTNLEVVQTIIKSLEKSDELIEYVTERPGHDKRYAIDPTKLEQLGWQPTYTFETGIAQTIEWYLDNKEWWEQMRTLPKINEMLEWGVVKAGDIIVAKGRDDAGTLLANGKRSMGTVLMTHPAYGCNVSHRRFKIRPQRFLTEQHYL